VKVVFAGTPEFAVPTLEAIFSAGHRLLAVYTQPDRPAGRGRQLTASPVKHFALAHHIPVAQPPSLKVGAAVDELRALQPDVMVVVAYGLILPQSVLDIPAYGCLNVHASLLPRWRGAAPIQRAVEAGDPVTGVTIMQMNLGLDTGDMLRTVTTPIGDLDTAQSLHDRLAQLGAAALVETLTQIEAGGLRPQPQDNALACYAAKLKKDEARVDWQQPAALLQRRIRAFNPWPVAYTRLQDRQVRLWEAAPVDPARAGDRHAAPGTLIAIDEAGIHVQTGEGVLTLRRLQVEGGRPLDAQAFSHGQRLATGLRFGD
jgi:methionyl-tRNA formyltransferase